MRNGFKFNGRHSSEIGVTVRTKSRPIRPPVKSLTTDLTCRDGVYDFSASNPSGREFYSDRYFTVSIGIYAENISKIQEKLTDISLWLTGAGELIFDDMPLIIWKGKISDEIIYMPEHNGRKAVIDVSFRAEPFGYCVFGTDGIVLDTDIYIDEMIPLEYEDLFDFTLSGSDDLRVLNFGDRPIRPVISLTGNVEGIIMELGEKQLSFTASGDVSVDFDKQIVTDENGSIGVSGEFFEFAAGENILHIENSNTDSIQISVSYTPEFMYGTHFGDVDWGDGDA